MEKHILRWTYWSGITCLVIAVVWRALNALGSVVSADTSHAGVSPCPTGTSSVTSQLACARSNAVD
jgi:hypothetical protein